MAIELWIVVGLVLLSTVGILWPKISTFLFQGNSPRNPDAFQVRMDLINDLLDACEGCEAETKAVVVAGDVIAKHWKEDTHK